MKQMTVTGSPADLNRREKNDVAEENLQEQGRTGARLEKKPRGRGDDVGG